MTGKPTGPATVQHRFLIVTAPRSGSYHLASLLDSAPGVTCLGEIFKENVVELPPDLRAATGFAAGMTAERDADPRGYLARLQAQAGTPVFGFKEFEVRLTRVKMHRALMRSPDWRKLYLVRNPLRKCISLLQARQSGAYTSARADGIGAPVQFDPAMFDKVLAADAKLRQSHDKTASLLPEQVSIMDYRDLFDAAKLKAALRFIGSDADVAALSSRYERQNLSDLRARVVDFDAMAGHLRAVGQAALLEDALRPDS